MHILFLLPIFFKVQIFKFQVWKDGMKVEASYRKRKHLSQYLPPSERYKLKVERPRPAAAAGGSAVNSPARTDVDRSAVSAGATSDTSLVESPSSGPASTGKRRPSDPDSEADMSLSGDSARMTSSGHPEVTNGEAQPPMKRSNTANEAPINGSNGLEVS